MKAAFLPTILRRLHCLVLIPAFLGLSLPVHAQPSEADLGLYLSAAPNPVLPGGALTLTLEAFNPLTEPVPDAVIEITLPPWTSYDPAASDGACALTEPEVGTLPGHSRVRCTFAELPPQPDPPGSLPVLLSFNVTARAHPLLAAGHNLVFQAALSAAVTDPQPGNNAAQVTVSVAASEHYLTHLPLVMFQVVPGFWQSGVIYVNQRATGANNGTSWVDAYTHLQPALAAAQPGEQIWVAAGEYTPDETDRSRAFELRSGVQVFGGFIGNESSLAERWQSGGDAHAPTILSGEIGGPGADDNSYHVVTAVEVDATAALDGFTIRAGQADGPADYRDVGGGLFLRNSRLALRNLVITDNLAAAGGGGMYLENSSPLIENVFFARNRAAEGRGGALLVSGGSSPQLTQAHFRANQARYGGAVCAEGGSAPVFFNVELWDNTADSGGAFYSTSAAPVLTHATIAYNHTLAPTSAALHQHSGILTVQNSIAWGSDGGAGPVVSEGPDAPVLRYAILQGLPDDPANHVSGSADPLLDDLTGGYLGIPAHSPAVDQANPDYLPPYLHVDLLGGPRASGAAPDLGAYEALNHAPVLESGEYALTEIIENVSPADNPGARLMDLLGGRITDEDPGSPLGVALVETNDARGVWQYQTSPSAAWVDVTDVSGSGALLLALDENIRVRFLPALDMNGEARLTVRAWDRADRYPPGSAGVNLYGYGAAQPYSAETAQLVQPVSAVTDVRLTLTLRPRAARPGETFTLLARLHNPEPEVIPNPTLTIVFPAGLTLEGDLAALGCAFAAPQTVTCALDSLPPSGTAGVTLTARITPQAAIWQPLRFSGEAAAGHIDPDLSNNRAAVEGLVARAIIPLPWVQRQP